MGSRAGPVLVLAVLMLQVRVREELINNKVTIFSLVFSGMLTVLK